MFYVQWLDSSTSVHSPTKKEPSKSRHGRKKEDTSLKREEKAKMKAERKERERKMKEEKERRRQEMANMDDEKKLKQYLEKEISRLEEENLVSILYFTLHS